MTRAVQQTFRKMRSECQVRGHLVSKPGRLALGVSSGGTLRCAYRGAERKIAAQIRHEFRKTDRFHCGEAGIEATCGKRGRFGQSAALDHLNEPGIARCI